MKFLKNFFNDESTIIGLCGFESMKPKYVESIKNDFYFNPFQQNPVFETNFSKNTLLF